MAVTNDMCYIYIYVHTKKILALLQKKLINF